MATEILCTPVGLQTPVGSQRVKDAMEDFHAATTDVANYFAQLWDEGAIANGLSFEESEEARRMLDIRDDAQDEFLRAISGVPAAKEVQA
jgi:hypothetical protein